MEILLKDYFESLYRSSEHDYAFVNAVNVEIDSYSTDGASCQVDVKITDEHESDWYPHTVTVNIWDIVGYFAEQKF